MLRPLESGEIREVLTKARPYMLERAITEKSGPAASERAGSGSAKNETDSEVMPIASPMAQIFSGRWHSEPPAFDQNATPEESFYEAAKRSRIPKLLLGGLALIAVSPLLVKWFIAVAPKAQSGIQHVTQKLRGNEQLAPPPAINNPFDTSNVATSPSGHVRVVTSYGAIGAGVAHLPFRHEEWPEFVLQVDRPNIPVRVKPSGKIPESIQRSAPITAGHPLEAAPLPALPGMTEPIAISEESARQLIEHSVDPAYPQEAVNAGIQGAVVLQAKISRDGSIRELHLVDGYFVLGRAVLQAVKQWRFRPYLVNGHAVEAQTTLTFNFRLPTVSGVAPRGVE
jgi:TonB family protein